MEVDDVEDDEVKGEEDEDVDNDDVEEEEDDDVEEEDRSQDRDPHLVRACTVDMHLQEKCRRPEPRRRLCASLRSQNARGHFPRATLYGNLQEKCRSPNGAP